MFSVIFSKRFGWARYAIIGGRAAGVLGIVKVCFCPQRWRRAAQEVPTRSAGRKILSALQCLGLRHFFGGLRTLPPTGMQSQRTLPPNSTSHRQIVLSAGHNCGTEFPHKSKSALHSKPLTVHRNALQTLGLIDWASRSATAAAAAAVNQQHITDTRGRRRWVRPKRLFSSFGGLCECCECVEWEALSSRGKRELLRQFGSCRSMWTSVFERLASFGTSGGAGGDQNSQTLDPAHVMPKVGFCPKWKLRKWAACCVHI